ncbi:MAG: DUF3737 family protein [Candidatus Nanohaloarchaea archaeon]|nr:DUF3737 family protein [Candidatus Nanohaloarchaea archaeon]
MVQDDTAAFRQQVAGLDIQDLKQEGVLDALVERRADVGSPAELEMDDILGYLEPDDPTAVSGTILDEGDWLLPRLALFHDALPDDAGYEEVRRRLDELPERVIDPDVPFDVPGEELEHVEAYSSFDSMYRHAINDELNREPIAGKALYCDDDWEKGDCLHYIESPTFDRTVFEAPVLAKGSRDAVVQASYLASDELFKSAERVRADDAVLVGEEVLRVSEDVRLLDSIVYGDRTLESTGKSALNHVFAVGRYPFRYSNGEGKDRINNSVVVAVEGMEEAHDLVIRDSVIVGEHAQDLWAKESVEVVNSYFVEDGWIGYCKEFTEERQTRLDRSNAGSFLREGYEA